MDNEPGGRSAHVEFVERLVQSDIIMGVNPPQFGRSRIMFSVDSIDSPARRPARLDRDYWYAVPFLARTTRRCISDQVSIICSAYKPGLAITNFDRHL